MSTSTDSPALPPMDTDAAPRVWVKKLTDKFFTRERLILLAQDLQIPDVDWSRTKMKKPDITQLVRKTLTDQPELAMDPRFVGLLVYRTSSATDGTGRDSHNGLTSAGNDAADVQEEANTKKQITPYVFAHQLTIYLYLTYHMGRIVFWRRLSRRLTLLVVRCRSRHPLPLVHHPLRTVCQSPWQCRPRQASVAVSNQCSVC